MKVLAVRLDSAWEVRESGFLRAERLLERAEPEPGSLVAVPDDGVEACLERRSVKPVFRARA